MVNQEGIGLKQFTKGDPVTGRGFFTNTVYRGVFQTYEDDGNLARVETDETFTGEVILKSASLAYDGPAFKVGDYLKGKGYYSGAEFLAEPPTPRESLLNEAKTLVHSDRNATYGEPTQNFSDTAALWNIQFSHKLREPFTADDVAQAMIGLKLARIKAANKRDNWVDIAGYAACGWECVEAGETND